MNVVGAIVTAGVAMVAVAIIALVFGKTMVALPGFDGTDAISVQMNGTMHNIAGNAATGFDLLSISPLVVAAGLIISILIGAFAIYASR